MLALLWISVLLFATFPLLGFGRYELQYPKSWCFLKFHFARSGRYDYWEVDAAYSCLYAAVNLLVITITIGNSSLL